MRPEMQIGQVVFAVLDTTVVSAIKYMSENHRIKATRRRFKGNRSKSVDIIVTIGKPNYAERQFIKLAKKSGERFPIKKIQLKRTRANSR